MRKAYTRNGDEGDTKDYAGKKLAKDDLSVIIAGKIDSLQSSIDLAMLSSRSKTKMLLQEIQKKLWQTAGEISCADRSCVIWPIIHEDIVKLERFTDSLGEPPAKFIRFDTLKAIQYNECRIRCRELETYLVKLLRKKRLRTTVYQYINRLSSVFFMLAYKETK